MLGSFERENEITDFQKFLPPVVCPSPASQESSKLFSRLIKTNEGTSNFYNIAVPYSLEFPPTQQLLD